MDQTDFIKCMERIFGSDLEFLEECIDDLDDEELEKFLDENPDFLK